MGGNVDFAWLSWYDVINIHHTYANNRTMNVRERDNFNLDVIKLLLKFPIFIGKFRKRVKVKL